MPYLDQGYALPDVKYGRDTLAHGKGASCAVLPMSSVGDTGYMDMQIGYVSGDPFPSWAGRNALYMRVPTSSDMNGRAALV